MGDGVCFANRDLFIKLWGNFIGERSEWEHLQITTQSVASAKPRKKRLPEGWLLSTSGSMPRQGCRFTPKLFAASSDEADYNSLRIWCQRIVVRINISL